MSDNTNLLAIEGVQDIPLSPATAISSVALNMALNWFNTTIVKDGAMYQQLKLEGKTIEGVRLSDVFDVAKQFEEYIIRAPDRLAAMILDASGLSPISDFLENATTNVVEVDDYWTFVTENGNSPVKFASKEAAQLGKYISEEEGLHINTIEKRFVEVTDIPAPTDQE